MRARRRWSGYSETSAYALRGLAGGGANLLDYFSQVLRARRAKFAAGLAAGDAKRGYRLYSLNWHQANKYRVVGTPLVLFLVLYSVSDWLLQRLIRAY